MKLLTKKEFRREVFERDNYRCVICREPGIGNPFSYDYNLDPHHIIEKRLFEDCGFYIDNGATLCEFHHILAEETNLSCEEIREKAGITNIILPDHLYDEYTYTKWGDIIQDNGRRIKGELFFDESVQKILKQGDVLHLYDKFFKYPRTFHLHFSNPSKDDKILKNYSALEGEEIIVTEKMDGENTSLYSDYAHARSLEFLVGQDRGWVKALHAQISHEIPCAWRICGENLFAKHSLEYNELDSYFNVFSIWNERNECLSWDETLEWCELLNFQHVPLLHRGVFNVGYLQKLSESIDTEKHEGFVVRPVRSFKYNEFKNVVCKWVRKNHVNKNSHHWRHQQIIPNKLKLK